MDNIKNNYEIGQKLEIEIEKIVFGGEGLGRVDGFTIFVPMSVPGDILEIEIISGGLFFGDNSKKIKEYGYFQEGNKKISEMYNVEFGKEYNKVVEEKPKTTLDSIVSLFASKEGK